MAIVVAGGSVARKKLDKFIFQQGPSLLQVYAGRGKEAVCNLAIGEPEDDPSEDAQDAICECMAIIGHAAYTSARGSQELLATIAESSVEMGMPNVSPKNVAASHGAKLSLDVAMRVLCHHGDHVLWFSPGYTFGRMAINNGLRSVPVLTDSNFNPDLEDLEAKLSAAANSNKLGVLIVNNPVNPTGRVWPPSVLKKVVELAVRFGAPIIADETYGSLVFSSAHFSPIASVAPEGYPVVTIGSGSKMLNMPGYRFGYIVSSEEIIKAIGMMLGDNVGCPNVLTQAAAIAALKHRHEIAAVQNKALREKSFLFTKWLKENSLQWAAMEGAYYSFIDFLPALQVNGWNDTVEMANALLRDCSVGIIPGAAFGDEPRLKNFARLSFAGNRDKLVEGLELIAERICA